MRSIKFYLFTRFLALILIQVGIVAVLALIFFERNVRHSIKENFQTLDSLARNFESYYKVQIGEFSRLVQRRGFAPYNREVAKAAVKDFIEIKSTVTTVHYYNAEGLLEFYVTLRDLKDYVPESNVRNHSNHKFIQAFDKCLLSARPVVSEPLKTKTGYLYHVIIVPVLDGGGKIHGALSFALFPDLQGLSSSFEGLALSDDNFLVLLDTQGNIVASTGTVPENLKPSISKAAFSEEQKESSYYILSKRVPNLPLIAVLGVNEAHFLAQKKRFFDFIYVMAAVSTLIVLGLSFLMARKAARGVNAVKFAAQAMRENRSWNRAEKEAGLNREMVEVLHELEDLSIEIQKGRLLGNFWGQEGFGRDEKKTK